MQARLIALQNQHAKLEHQLVSERQRANPDGGVIARVMAAKRKIRNDMAALLHRQHRARAASLA